METLNITVSGSYKEKALLTSIIADQLKKVNIHVNILDTTSDALVREKFDDLVNEFKETNTVIQLAVEDLYNTNVLKDIQNLHLYLSTGRFDKEDDTWNNAIATVRDEIKEILLL